MKLIAIDTSGTAALWMGVLDGKVIDPVEVDGGQRHDEVLGEGIRSWMIRNGWDKVDAVAVVVGPGSFTGLRVGVAFATGFATALGVPVLPVPAYERLAASVESGTVWALPFASRGEVRGRWMKGGEVPSVLSDVHLFHVDDIPPSPVDGPILPLGEGYEREKAVIDAALGNRKAEMAILDPFTSLARAATALWRRKEAVAPKDVDVDYGAEFRPTPRKNGKG